MNIKPKKMKETKVAKVHIDILGDYISENGIQVSIENVSNILKTINFSKDPSKIIKCLLYIYKNEDLSYRIDIKSKKKEKFQKSFNFDIIGLPLCQKIHLKKFGKKYLVFLPVLELNQISEIIIFRPRSISAENFMKRVMPLIEAHKQKLLVNSGGKENLKDEIISQKRPDISSNFASLSVKEDMNNIAIDNQSMHIIHDLSIGNKQRSVISSNFENMNAVTKKNEMNKDNTSLYSISSNFINNWYSKLQIIPNFKQKTMSLASSINEELRLLNQNLKEIRMFMNDLYQIVNRIVQNKKRHDRRASIVSKDRYLSQPILFPAKNLFIEIVQKIKSCINLAVAHENLIINPSATEIVNQLFTFLRILGDATLNPSSGISELIIGIEYPMINSSTVKFLSDKLTSENIEYWCVLGHHFGYVNSHLFNIDKMNFDEFELRKTSQLSESEKNINLKLLAQYDNNNNGQRSYEKYKTLPLMTNYIHNSNERENIPVRYTQYYDSDNFNLQHQTIPYSYGSSNFICSNIASWDDKQSRFIDTVRLRNGKLGKIISTRSAQNYHDLGVTINEVVEILKDHGNSLLVKNALGETGDCPKSNIESYQYH